MTALHRIEAAAARAALRALRALGPVRASNLGGAVARSVGPMLPVSRVADANLGAARNVEGHLRGRVDLDLDFGIVE